RGVRRTAACILTPLSSSQQDRQKRKPGFRPLRGSSAPASGTPPEHSSVRGDSTRRQRKHKKMEKKSGGGFFQRWFGGTERTTPERGQTVSPARAISPNRDENDYATIDRIRFGKRESSMPASPRNVRFTEQSLQTNNRAQMQYRPRGLSLDNSGNFSASGGTRGPGSRSTQQSLTQLDEATLDLLRLSSEPEAGAAVSFTSSKRVNPAADYLPKAASTSSVNKMIRTPDGGHLRVANVYTWGVESDDEILDARNQSNGLPESNRMRSNGLSPQAMRRNELQLQKSINKFVDEPQAYLLSPQPRRRSDTVDGNYAKPFNGDLGDFSTGPPFGPLRQPSAAKTSPFSVPPQRSVLAQPSSSHQQIVPSVPLHQNHTGSPLSKRRVETIVDYEKKKQGPPVIRTTVEGKLRMEKIVGADLITVDSCVSSAWTVRDTITNYKIKSTIGKKSLILEEMKEGHSKFKITLIENGETKMEKEATLEIPDFMNKKDYLSEVGQRLLRDLREDADAVSAVTHVEVEVVEDVTNILKTYVIGERAEEYLEEEMPQALHYEETADRTPSPILQEKVEKIYVDTLTREEEEWHELEKADIRVMRDGHHFEGEGALKRTRRLETDDSVEVVPKARCANAFADCDLIRREDSSNFTVHIAIPLVKEISMILTRRVQKSQQKLSKAFAMEQAGQFFEDETSLRRLHGRVESAEEENLIRIEEEEPIFQKVKVNEVAVEK
uniref:ULP_PROTEASE domain-containing protein n=1 Tax=Haemonchus contortus TaxID=6289 RepID=A0A7I5E7B1_HAECO